jgi:hypothetical protein
MNFQPLKRSRALIKKSKPSQIQKALNAVKGEQGTSLWSGLKKAERFHFRLVQQRAFDRRKK